jgi:hypothetical protein
MPGMSWITGMALLLTRPKLPAKEIGRLWTIIQFFSIIILPSVLPIVSADRFLCINLAQFAPSVLRWNPTYFDPDHIVGREMEILNGVFLA